MRDYLLESEVAILDHAIESIQTHELFVPKHGPQSTGCWHLELWGVVEEVTGYRLTEKGRRLKQEFEQKLSETKGE